MTFFLLFSSIFSQASIHTSTTEQITKNTHEWISDSAFILKFRYVYNLIKVRWFCSWAGQLRVGSAKSWQFHLWANGGSCLPSQTLPVYPALRNRSIGVRSPGCLRSLTVRAFGVVACFFFLLRQHWAGAGLFHCLPHPKSAGALKAVEPGSCRQASFQFRWLSLWLFRGQLFLVQAL